MSRQSFSWLRGKPGPFHPALSAGSVLCWMASRGQVAARSRRVLRARACSSDTALLFWLVDCVMWICPLTASGVNRFNPGLTLTMTLTPFVLTCSEALGCVLNTHALLPLARGSAESMPARMGVERSMPTSTPLSAKVRTGMNGSNRGVSTIPTSIRGRRCALFLRIGREPAEVTVPRSHPG